MPVQYPVFAGFPELVCRTTTRVVPAGDDGPAPYNLGLHTGPNRAHAAARRRRLCDRLGLDFSGLTTAEQVHAGGIAVVGSPERGRGRLERSDALAGADGLATDLPDTPLLIFTADCCPVVVYDPVRRAVAAVHAGRKGTAGGIAAAAVTTLVERFASRPQDMAAAIGPCIGPCCYQVGPEIRAEFPDRPELFRERDGRLYLDLWAANLAQLADAGVPAGRVSGPPLCTGCRTDLLFSYRKEGTGCGLLGTIVGLSKRADVR